MIYQHSTMRQSPLLHWTPGLHMEKNTVMPAFFERCQNVVREVAKMPNAVALETLNHRKVVTERVKASYFTNVEKIDKKVRHGKSLFDSLSSTAIGICSKKRPGRKQWCETYGQIPERPSTSFSGTTLVDIIAKRQRRNNDDKTKFVTS